MLAFRYLFGVSVGAVIALGNYGIAIAQNEGSSANRHSTAQSSLDVTAVSAESINHFKTENLTITSKTELVALGKTELSAATSSTPLDLEGNSALLANLQVSKTVNLESSSMPLAQLPELPEKNQQQQQQDQQNQQQNQQNQLEEFDEPLEPVEDTEQLNPNANPLQLPTKTEEVKVDEVTPITLEQALKLARKNNQTLKEARLNLNQAQQQLQEALGAEFPTLSLQTDLQRSTSATNEIRAANSDPNFPSPDGVTTDVNATLQLNYNLYTGGRRSSQIALAEARVRTQQLALEQAAEQLRLDVKNAYYAVQEAESQVEIARAAVEDAEQSVRDAELLREAGLGTRFDVLQAEVDLRNEEQNLTQAISQRRVSRRQLVEVLGLSQQTEVTAATPAQVAGEWNLSLEESIVKALQNRAELQQQLAQRKIGKENQDIALASIKPQVSLFTRYDVRDVIDSGSGAGTGIGDGLAMGVQVQWNFFDGGQSQARARQAEQDVAIAENRFDQLRNQIRREVEQAFFNLQANKDNIDTARLGVEQAEESLRLARLRFQAGVGTQTDVINAQAALTSARGNLLTAIINYNRSLARLKRAVSNYPDGRLFDTP